MRLMLLPVVSVPHLLHSVVVMVVSCWCVISPTGLTLHPQRLGNFVLDSEIYIRLVPAYFDRWEFGSPDTRTSAWAQIP